MTAAAVVDGLGCLSCVCLSCLRCLCRVCLSCVCLSCGCLWLFELLGLCLFELIALFGLFELRLFELVGLLWLFALCSGFAFFRFAADLCAGLSESTRCAGAAEGPTFASALVVDGCYLCSCMRVRACESRVLAS